MTIMSSTIEAVAAIERASDLKAKRGAMDVLADRIRQASTEPTLPAFLERLMLLLNVSLDSVYRETLVECLAASNDTTSAQGMLRWLRENPNTAALLCYTKHTDRGEAMEALRLPDGGADDDQAPPGVTFDLPLRVICVTPLAHGADVSTGNAKLFRRQAVRGVGGSVMELPFYGGNALRGQMRDLLADHFLQGLGITPNRTKPPLELWFFYALYSGGVLEEGGGASKALQKELGQNGSDRITALTLFRDNIPPLSVLGAALGNRVIPGKIQVGDLRPECRQWGTGEADVSSLMEWSYLTRREDCEDHQENHSMIATSEVLKAGTVLRGGIDVCNHATEIERGCIGRGIELLTRHGYLGAESRRGLGRVVIEAENVPSPEVYDEFLAENRDGILSYLEVIGAYTPCTP